MAKSSVRGCRSRQDRGSRVERELVVAEEREEEENSNGFIHNVGNPCQLA